MSKKNRSALKPRPSSRLVKLTLLLPAPTLT
jgi:hypothetical protein